ncbi:hypothetical protein GF357_04715 [Candidatus Dojkabacteria bacterium]|nr:hypothetical protein [Candidatus Dojkabacteria bacterium]
MGSGGGVKLHVSSSQREFEKDGDDRDLYYLPPRVLFAALGADDAWAILPKDEGVQRYASQYRRIVGEAVSNSHLPMKYDCIDQGDLYLLDAAICQQIGEVYEMHRQRFGDRPVRVWPYVNSQEVRQWVQALRCRGLDVSIAFAGQNRFPHPQNRGGWGRLWTDRGTPGFAEMYGIPYPQSYVVNDAAEMTQALAEFDGRAVWAKPVFGSGGYTNMKLRRARDVAQFYERLIGFGQFRVNGQVMPVEIQADLGDMFPNTTGIEFGSLQYLRQRILTPGAFTRQRIDIQGQWYGNDYNVNWGHGVEEQLYDIWDRFRKGMKDFGGGSFNDIGGIDFAVIDIEDKDPEVVVVENNGGRQTGASPANIMARLMGVEDEAFTAVKIDGADGIEVEQIWNVLVENRLNLMRGQQFGAIPLVWVDGGQMIFIVGESHEAVQETYDQIQNLVFQRGPR